MSTTIIYRLPFAKEMTVLDKCKKESLETIDDLKGRCGFVLVPFDTMTEEHRIHEENPASDERKSDVKAKTHEIQLFTSCNISVMPVPEGNKQKIGMELVSNNKETYNRAFASFICKLKEGKTGKLVLSRKEEYKVTLSIEEIKNIYYCACKAYPRMMIYLISTEEGESWIGCTPEILLEGEKSHYKTVALAGTMKSDSSDVEWSEKNRHEQKIVVEYIRKRLHPYCEVVEEEGPYTSRAGHLVHLKTEFHFTPYPGLSIIDVVKSLHPTPAVCGMPREDSLSFINSHEGYDREYYAGVVGYLDTTREGMKTSLYVNLRCAKYSDSMLTLFAGGGILPVSELDSEWEETEVKMQTIKSLLS